MKKLIVFVFLLFAVPLVAQCTVRKVVLAPTYHAPIVHHTPLAYAPVKVVAVEVQREHYYSIDPYAQQLLLLDALEGRIRRMQAEGVLKGQPVANPVTTPVSTDKRPVATPTGAGAYQNDKLLAVVSNSCAKCHGPESKLTRLVTADGKLADVSVGKVWESFGLTNIGKMPKAPGKALANEEVELFVEWAENARK